VKSEEKPVRLKKWLPFLIAFVLPLVIIYVWWGGLNPVRVTEDQMRGPYVYAYMQQQGDYSKLPDLQGKVGKALVEQHVAPGKPITVLYSDPDVVAVGDRLARTGYLIPDGVRVRPPLKQDAIPARPVLLVQVRTAIMLAPSRAYQALDGYLKKRGEHLSMPTVEVYDGSDSLWRNGTLNVEMARARGPKPYEGGGG
jgi:hypothetical protein